jgi:ABC-2 type transport system permease protein
MFLRIALFEIRFWLRSWMVWIFLFIIALLIFGAVSSDQVQLGSALSNTYHNAPYVIQN